MTNKRKRLKIGLGILLLVILFAGSTELLKMVVLTRLQAQIEALPKLPVCHVPSGGTPGLRSPLTGKRYWCGIEEGKVHIVFDYGWTNSPPFNELSQAKRTSQCRREARIGLKLKRCDKL